jgi:hypothetical protein
MTYLNILLPRPQGIGIYTSPTAPSPKGEGWDEGNVNA